MSTISVDLFTRHTTCALTILTNEDGIAEDFVTVRDGRLALGEFQRIVLVEFEGPRTRTIDVDV